MANHKPIWFSSIAARSRYTGFHSFINRPAMYRFFETDRPSILSGVRVDARFNFPARVFVSTCQQTRRIQTENICSIEITQRGFSGWEQGLPTRGHSCSQSPHSRSARVDGCALEANPHLFTSPRCKWHRQRMKLLRRTRRCGWVQGCKCFLFGGISKNQVRHFHLWIASNVLTNVKTW